MTYPPAQGILLPKKEKTPSKWKQKLIIATITVVGGGSFTILGIFLNSRWQAKSVEEVKTLVVNPISTQDECINPFSLDQSEVDQLKRKWSRKNGGFLYPYGPFGIANANEGYYVIESIPAKFKRMKIEYEIDDVKNTKSPLPPSFIWGLSRSVKTSIFKSGYQQLVRSWIPEYSGLENTGTLQNVRFFINDDYESSQLALKRLYPEALNHPVKYLGVTNTLVITRNTTNGSLGNYTFEYFLKEKYGDMTYTFLAQIPYPFSNLENSLEKVDLELGTFYGHGLRVVSINICE